MLYDSRMDTRLRALLCLSLAFALNGCATHGFFDGTVSYAANPPMADRAGALPLRALICLDPNYTPASRQIGIALGDRCHLFASTRTLPTLTVEGTCALPTAAGPVTLTVRSALAQFQHRSIDVTVDGTTSDGHYLTYRFTGVRGANDAGDECDALQTGNAGVLEESTGAGLKTQLLP